MEARALAGCAQAVQNRAHLRSAHAPSPPTTGLPSAALPSPPCSLRSPSSAQRRSLRTLPEPCFSNLALQTSDKILTHAPAPLRAQQKPRNTRPCLAATAGDADATGMPPLRHALTTARCNVQMRCPLAPPPRASGDIDQHTGWLYPRLMTSPKDYMTALE